MRVTLAICLLLMVALGGCSRPKGSDLELPSGRKIRVLGITRVTFANEPPLLEFRYHTNSSINDLVQLRREAEDIWPYFKPQVEENTYERAVITAVKPQRRFAFLQSSNNFGFGLIRLKNGTWKHINWGRDYSAEEFSRAKAILTDLAASQYLAASSSLHYPRSYSAEEKRTDSGEVRDMLELIASTFGEVREFKLSKNRFTYDAVTVMTATPEYWSASPSFGFLPFDVEYSLLGEGYIVIDFSIIDEIIEIRSIRFAMPSGSPSTRETLRELSIQLDQVSD